MKLSFLKNKKSGKISRKNSKGFTMIELLVTIAIFTVVVIALTEFERDVFYLNSVQSGSFSTNQDAQAILNTMVKQIRSASEGSDGSYPIVTATGTALTIYSDIYENGVKEKVTYFLSGTTLQEAIIVPTGVPISYPTATTTTLTLLSNVRNGTSTDVFSYYDTKYTGTSSPLVQPVSIPVIRLIRVTLILDASTNRPAPAVTYTSQVSIRNLKNNL